MADDATKTYRLYALPLTGDNIALAAAERFSRATPTPEPGYVLIYTHSEPPRGAQEINEERTALLSQADIRWLFDSNAAIVAEEIEKNKPEVLKNLSARMETLEAELKRTKEKIDRKGE